MSEEIKDIQNAAEEAAEAAEAAVDTAEAAAGDAAEQVAEAAEAVAADVAEAAEGAVEEAAEAGEAAAETVVSAAAAPAGPAPWVDEATYALLKEKLGVNAFKEVGEFHIHIKEGAERNERMKKAILVCPAGLYKLDKEGNVTVTEDGCLECGTCKIAVGDDLLEWRYPDAMCGVQYRFG